MNDQHILKGFIMAVAGGLLIRLLWQHSQYNNNPPRPARPASEKWSYQTAARQGVAGTIQTLSWMAWLVRRDAGDLELRNLATKITNRCGGHDFGCEVKALFEFVRDEITFRKDPVSVERVQDAKRTIYFKSGDCDDKSVLLSSLLAALGHKSCFSVLGNQPNNFSHVFVSLITPSGFIPLDPTNEAAQVGWQGQARTIKHFKIFA